MEDEITRQCFVTSSPRRNHLRRQYPLETSRLEVQSNASHRGQVLLFPFPFLFSEWLNECYQTTRSGRRSTCSTGCRWQDARDANLEKFSRKLRGTMLDRLERRDASIFSKEFYSRGWCRARTHFTSNLEDLWAISRWWTLSRGVQKGTVIFLFFFFDSFHQFSNGSSMKQSTLVSRTFAILPHTTTVRRNCNCNCQTCAKGLDAILLNDELYTGVNICLGFFSLFRRWICTSMILHRCKTSVTGHGCLRKDPLDFVTSIILIELNILYIFFHADCLHSDLFQFHINAYIIL